MNKAHTTADKLLMSEVESKFREVMKKKGWDVKTAAKELGVSRASFYNYLKQTDVPRYEVLRWAHDKWALNFSYMSFEMDESFFKRHRKEDKAANQAQHLLPFLEKVRQRDVHVVKIEPKPPNSVHVELEIEFVG